MRWSATEGFIKHFRRAEIYTKEAFFSMQHPAMTFHSVLGGDRQRVISRIWAGKTGGASRR
jgi:hypothetical protein